MSNYDQELAAAFFAAEMQKTAGKKQAGLVQGARGFARSAWSGAKDVAQAALYGDIRQVPSVGARAVRGAVNATREGLFSSGRPGTAAAPVVRPLADNPPAPRPSPTSSLATFPDRPRRARSALPYGLKELRKVAAPTLGQRALVGAFKKPWIPGAAIGATVGLLNADRGEGLSDAAIGGVLGATAGYLGRKPIKGLKKQIVGHKGKEPLFGEDFGKYTRDAFADVKADKLSKQADVLDPSAMPPPPEAPRRSRFWNAAKDMAMGVGQMYLTHRSIGAGGGNDGAAQAGPDPLSRKRRKSRRVRPGAGAPQQVAAAGTPPPPPAPAAAPTPAPTPVSPSAPGTPEPGSYAAYHQKAFQDNAHKRLRQMGYTNPGAASQGELNRAVYGGTGTRAWRGTMAERLAGRAQTGAHAVAQKQLAGDAMKEVGLSDASLGGMSRGDLMARAKGDRDVYEGLTRRKNLAKDEAFRARGAQLAQERAAMSQAGAVARNTRRMVAPGAAQVGSGTFGGNAIRLGMGGPSLGAKAGLAARSVGHWGQGLLRGLARPFQKRAEEQVLARYRRALGR